MKLPWHEHRTTPHVIELNLVDVGQLFNSMDATPFRAKDLDKDAEEFIIDWANEFPIDEPVALRIHLDQWPQHDPSQVVTDAVHNFFAYRAKLADLEFKRLMRQGRLSLLIGALFLAACLSVSALLDREDTAKTGSLIDYLRQSLTIAGWVAMWRPMQIYLYDWWPVRRQGRHFLRLSTMPVEVLRTVPRKDYVTPGLVP